MALQERLEALGRRVEGAVGAALLGEDGVPLGQWSAPGALPGVDLEASWVECGPLVSEARRLAGPEGGLEALTLQAARHWALVCVVDDRHHVVLSLSPGGNVGKGRYLLRLNAPEFRREVAELS